MASELKRRFLQSIGPLIIYFKWNGLCIDVVQNSKFKNRFAKLLWMCFFLFLNIVSGLYIVVKFVATASTELFKLGSNFSQMNSLNGVIAHSNPVLFGVLTQISFVTSIQHTVDLTLLPLERVDYNLGRPKLRKVRQIAIISIIFVVMSV